MLDAALAGFLGFDGDKNLALEYDFSAITLRQIIRKVFGLYHMHIFYKWDKEIA